MRASKSSTPVSRYFSDVGQSFMKTVADKHGHAIGFCMSREN